MTRKTLACVVILFLAGFLPATAANDATARDQASSPEADYRTYAEGEHRSAANRARNAYRHPVETLLFFGLKPDMTVVELWPGAGWYTEIIAPIVRDRGAYYAAGFDQESAIAYFGRVNRAFAEKLAARPDLYGHVKVTELAPPEKLDIAPPGSADLVLTFRNLHNWMARGQAETVLRAAYRALKPGGVLGLVEHRGNPAVEQDPKAASGYVNEDYAIALAEAVGFELVAKSEVNANPRDTKDYEMGVWTLPPTLRLGDKDREKYLAIGESDRMTLKFVKPAE
ncbi:MAG: methyltransferase [Alphaproteobacteria bacterium]|nr:MAG: methyltransferase [Alphaproteobacteria bacterium]